MPESELLQIDYYFRKERLSDEGGERAHARIVEALPEAKAGGLLSDFRVMEHARGFPDTDGRAGRPGGSSEIFNGEENRTGPPVRKQQDSLRLVPGARAARECRR